ncbi:MAG: DUF559 domain-containing protein [Burkholderiales bacterium]
MTAIANGWEDANLDDICEVIRGITFPTTEKRFQPGAGLIACLRTANVQATVDWDDLWFVPRQHVKNDDQLVAIDDVLISTANSYDLVGKVSRVTHTKHVSTLGAFISLLRAYKGIDAGFLFYQMSSEFVQRCIREMSSTTTNISNVSGAKLKTLRLSIAPAAEQTRIVAKLEELLSDLDAGVAELKAAQKKLAQYRQSLLKAAVEGALTADWRAARAPLPLGGGGAGGEGANPLRQSGSDDPTPPLPNPSPARGEGLNTDDQIWLANRARELRRDQTPDEQALWHQLRGKRFAGYKFRRQQVLGRFIVDFVCFAQRVIVELDGGQHATAAERDRARDEWLGQQGFRVLRFWNNEWSAQPEGVLEAIWLALQQEPPLPNPSPARGEGLHTAASDHSPSVGPKAPLPLDGGGAGGEGETGAQLLERILTERRARWEAKQLAKFKEQGKSPPKDWQKKYPEPVKPDTSDLPELPEGWVWASLDMLGEIASGVAKGSKIGADIKVREVPYLRVANVQRGFLDLSEVKTVLATERDIAELTLKDGDVLFNEGGDRDKLGRGWVWRDEVADCIHQNHVFRMRPYLPEVLPELISHHGNTFGKTWFQNAGKQTTNLASINLTMLRMFPVPLGPAEEQRELLTQLDLQIEQIVQQEQAVELALKQSTAQRQNILRAAFSGQLVAQDPNDEPASALLERIRAERVQRDAVKKPRGQGKINQDQP